jgi:hypothetical protein
MIIVILQSCSTEDHINISKKGDFQCSGLDEQFPWWNCSSRDMFKAMFQSYRKVGGHCLASEIEEEIKFDWLNHDYIFLVNSTIDLSSEWYVKIDDDCQYLDVQPVELKLQELSPTGGSIIVIYELEKKNQLRHPCP